MYYNKHFKDNIVKQSMFRSKYSSILEVVIDENKFYNVSNLLRWICREANKLNLN